MAAARHAGRNEAAPVASTRTAAAGRQRGGIGGLDAVEERRREASERRGSDNAGQHSGCHRDERRARRRTGHLRAPCTERKAHADLTPPPRDAISDCAGRSDDDEHHRQAAKCGEQGAGRPLPAGSLLVQAATACRGEPVELRATVNSPRRPTRRRAAPAVRAGRARGRSAPCSTSSSAIRNAATHRRLSSARGRGRAGLILTGLPRGLLVRVVSWFSGEELARRRGWSPIQ